MITKIKQGLNKLIGYIEAQHKQLAEDRISRFEALHRPIFQNYNIGNHEELKRVIKDFISYSSTKSS